MCPVFGGLVTAGGESLAQTVKEQRVDACINALVGAGRLSIGGGGRELTEEAST